MKIVRFENGYFAIRKNWFFGWNFVDLSCPRFYWKVGDYYFKDCLGNENTVRAKYEELINENKYTIVD